MFTALCETAGQPIPADTYQVRTGRGGRHLYYQHPELGPQLRNTRAALGWLVDTRAAGGYVVAPPSTVAGRPYTVTHDTDPAPLPRWLVDLLTPAPLPPQQPVAVELPAGRHHAYLTAAVDAELTRITGSPAGGHNDALYRASVALGQLVAGGALPEPTIRRALLATALQHAAAAGCDCTQAAITRTIGSGLRAGTNRPRTVAA